MTTYRELQTEEAKLEPIRSALYDAHGPGYYVFPQFLSPEAAATMARYWGDLNPVQTHQKFIHRQCFSIRCPNVVQGPNAEGNVVFYNFFWNAPPDEATQAIAHQIQTLRSRIERRQVNHELFPVYGDTMISGVTVAYRVSISKQGRSIVPPHRDWVRRPANDPRRLQATLVLSKKGQDYRGRGFSIETNQGRAVILGDDLMAEPGDLLVWPYNHLHSVSDVATDPGQLGFARLTLPTVTTYGPHSRVREFIWQVRIGQRYPRAGEWFRHYVRPVYRAMRGGRTHRRA